MGWDVHNTCRRYTRSRRAPDGRVLREYIGVGAKGEQAAAEDAARRAQRQAERQAYLAEDQRWRDAQQPLELFSTGADFLTRAALVLGGYYKHGGEWRPRHDD